MRTQTQDPTPALAEGGSPGSGEAPGSWLTSLYMAWGAQLFASLAFSVIVPFIPFYIRELGVRDEGAVAIWAGALVTGSGIMMAVFSPIWGTLADRYGRKLMVQRAMFGGAVIISLMALVTNVYQLLILRTIQGALTGTVAASVAMVSSFTPGHKRGYSLGLMQMAVFSGGALGPWVGGIVADYAGYRMPFAVTGLLLLIGAVMVTFGVRETNAREFTLGPGNGPTMLRGLFGVPGFPLMLGVFFLISFSNIVVAPIMPLFVEHLMPKAERVATTVGLLMGLVGVTAGIGAVVIGRISDRVGASATLLVCTLGAAVSSIWQASAATVGQLFAIRVGFGLVAGGTQPTVNTLVANIVPEDAYGKAYGLTSSAHAIGMATGPMVGGLIASSLGLRAPFVLAGVLLLGISMALALRIVRRRSRPAAPKGE